MFIGKLLVEKYDLDFAEKGSLDERCKYVQGLVEHMYLSHYDKLRYLVVQRDNTKTQVVLEPEFLIEANSLMNNPFYENELDRKTWEEVRSIYKTETVAYD